MIISIAQLIDHAIRRCGVTTTIENPEILLQAKNNLQFVLFDMANRGVPIWEVQKQIIGLQPYKWIYDLDNSIYDIFDVNWRTFNHALVNATGGADAQNLVDYNWDTIAITTDTFQLSIIPTYPTSGSNMLGTARLGPTDPSVLFTLGEMPDTQVFDYWGINPVGDQTVSFVIEGSSDYIDWTVLSTYTDYNLIDSQWLWVDLDTPFVGRSIRLRLTEEITLPLTLRGFYTGNRGSAYEQVASKMNRDDFFSYPNKGNLGTPINFYFQKTTIPQFMLWQSTNNANVFNWAMNTYQMIVPFVDLTLPLPLNIPAWYWDGIAWNLAAKMVYELQGVPADRLPVILTQAKMAMSQMEASNSDSAPINLLGSALGAYQGYGSGGGGRK